ncbi:hypothetical protein [Spirosoma arcticum]
MKAAQQRSLMRWIHLIGAAAIGLYVYAPWRDAFWFTLLMQAIILPSLTLTGLWMWLGHTLRKKAPGRLATPSRHAN